MEEYDSRKKRVEGGSQREVQTSRAFFTRDQPKEDLRKRATNEITV